jgi:hypothetical protein
MNGFQFFKVWFSFVPMDLSFWSYMHLNVTLMMSMDEAIKWNKNSITLFVLHALCLWGRFLDYVYSLYGMPRGVEQDVARHVVHLHFVIRLQDLCFKNGGIYIKFG